MLSLCVESREGLDYKGLLDILLPYNSARACRLKSDLLVTRLIDSLGGQNLLSFFIFFSHKVSIYSDQSTQSKTMLSSDDLPPYSLEAKPHPSDKGCNLGQLQRWLSSQILLALQIWRIWSGRNKDSSSVKFCYILE